MAASFVPYEGCAAASLFEGQIKFKACAPRNATYWIYLTEVNQEALRMTVVISDIPEDGAMSLFGEEGGIAELVLQFDDDAQQEHRLLCREEGLAKKAAKKVAALIVECGLDSFLEGPLASTFASMAELTLEWDSSDDVFVATLSLWGGRVKSAIELPEGERWLVAEVDDF